jgi:hypothetical protein
LGTSQPHFGSQTGLQQRILPQRGSLQHFGSGAQHFGSQVGLQQRIFQQRGSLQHFGSGAQHFGSGAQHFGSQHDFKQLRSFQQRGSLQHFGSGLQHFGSGAQHFGSQPQPLPSKPAWALDREANNTMAAATTAVTIDRLFISRVLTNPEMGTETTSSPDRRSPRLRAS